jgi:hypothetical protein
MGKKIKDKEFFSKLQLTKMKGMGWTPLSAAISIFPPTQKFFSLHVDVLLLLLFLAHPVNTSMR